MAVVSLGIGDRVRVETGFGQEDGMVTGFESGTGLESDHLYPIVSLDHGAQVVLTGKSGQLARKLYQHSKERNTVYSIKYDMEGRQWIIAHNGRYLLGGHETAKKAAQTVPDGERHNFCPCSICQTKLKEEQNETNGSN